MHNYCVLKINVWFMAMHSVCVTIIIKIIQQIYIAPKYNFQWHFTNNMVLMSKYS